MAVDYLAALDPAVGIAESWSVVSPNTAGSPLWAVAITLADSRAHPFASVGAFGLRRADTLMRAVGEAVERIALRPHAGTVTARVSARSDLPGEVLTDPTFGVGSDNAMATWYEARSVIDGRSVWIEAPLVDFPCDAGPAFDPSPSGAAAGIGWDHAVYNALREIVERDAAMCSWYGGTATRWDIDAIRFAAQAAHRPDVVRLLDMAREVSPSLTIVRTVAEVDEMTSVLAVMTSGAKTAVGAGASEDGWRSIATAVQESLQIALLLEQADLRHVPLRTDGRVADDVERARFWSSPEAADGMSQWLATLSRESSEPRALSPLTARQLAERMAARSGPPLIVDLTARLPDAIRASGWCAVRAIVPGFAPLRMREEGEHGWIPGRITRSRADKLPHPLI